MLEMKLYRDKFSRLITKIFGGFGPRGSVLASGSQLSKTAIIGYAFGVAIEIAVTVLVVYFFNEQSKYILPAIWGFGLGLGFLIFLPSRVLFSAFGFIVGVGTAGTLSDFVERLANNVNSVTTTINNSGSLSFSVETASVWIFFAVVAAFLIPAFKD